MHLSLSFHHLPCTGNVMIFFSSAGDLETKDTYVCVFSRLTHLVLMSFCNGTHVKYEGRNNHPLNISHNLYFLRSIFTR